MKIVVGGFALGFKSLCPSFRTTPVLYYSQICLSRPFSTSRLGASASSRESTIYALSSGKGKAGIAVIRCSGPACLDIYRSLCPGMPLPRPRFATVRKLLSPAYPSAAAVVGHSDPVVTTSFLRDEPIILDSQALVLYFPGPRSVTGEDVLELHVHGGPATVRAVLAAIPRALLPVPSTPSPLTSLPTRPLIRYAAAGEFTQRAFLNGRLDAAQVEAQAATLSAESEQHRRAIERGRAAVDLGARYEAWRASLIAARAQIEALLDFAEDQHFDNSNDYGGDAGPNALLSASWELVRETIGMIKQHEAAARCAELLRTGFRVTLIGPPNAGKSSLMNILVGGESVSIVTAEAGTTRDVVQHKAEIGGYLCTFADTAGFRATSSPSSSPANSIGCDNDPAQAISSAEREGIRRAERQALGSDVVIVLASVEPDIHGKHDFDIRFDPHAMSLAAQSSARSIVVVNKVDTLPADSAFRDQTIASFMNKLRREFKFTVDTPVVGISCLEAAAGASPTYSDSQNYTLMPGGGGGRHDSSDTGKSAGGIDSLRDVLARIFTSMAEPPELRDLLGVTARQAQFLAQCRAHLEAVGHLLSCAREHDVDVVLVAENLRLAAAQLAKLTGRDESGDIEEVLGAIFEKFCVGK